MSLLCILACQGYRLKSNFHLLKDVSTCNNCLYK